MLAAAGAAVLLAALAPPAGRHLLWRRELNPILSGRLLAEELGCYGCHRSFSSAEIPNPGSRWGSVPRFAAGNAMMYARSRRELEEFVRFGAPRAWLDDPAAVTRLEDQPVRMPAYGPSLSDAEVADLVAFTAAVERVGDFPEGADDPGVAEGRALAREQGCFSCHGVDGSGGLPNPGSLGGFTPGFLGGNFVDMVRDGDEFREWVLDGTSRRLAANPLVRWFWRRQKLSMPAYRDRLSDEQVEAIWRWIEAARASGTTTD